VPITPDSDEHSADKKDNPSDKGLSDEEVSGENADHIDNSSDNIDGKADAET
jgi:hypothetical protein